MQALEKNDRKPVRFLGALLRVADGLDRCHSQRVSSVNLALDQHTLTLTVQARGQPELEMWAAQRKGDLLAKLVARQLVVKSAPPRRARREGSQSPQTVVG